MLIFKAASILSQGLGAGDDCLGLRKICAGGGRSTIHSRNSQKQREQCLGKQSLPGAQPGDAGAAQGRERNKERQLGMKGKELNLRQVSRLTS